MSRQTFPNTIPIWARRASGGGPTPGGADLRVAKYIVGNATAGDTLDVCDFLDPGDGTGFALALAAASVLGSTTAGDIYLRPGVYDLDLPTSPPLPLAAPPLGTIRCAAAPHAPLGAGFDVSAAVISVGSNRHVLEASAFGFSLVTLENLQFYLQDVPAPVGAQVLGGPSTIIFDLHNVLFGFDQLQDGALTLVNTPSGTLRVSGGGVNNFGAGAQLAVTAYDVGPGEIYTNAVGIGRVGLGIVAGAGQVTGGNVNSYAGISFTGAGPGIDTYFNIAGVQFTPEGGAAISIIGDNRGVISGCRIRGPGSGQGVATAGNNVAITGCYIQGMDVGVDVLAGAARTLVVGNIITSSAVMAIQDAGIGTITGNNIT